MSYSTSHQQRLKDAIQASLAAPKPKTLITLKSRMPFGKYKGECIAAILKHDPQYIRWFTNETSVTVDNSVKEALLIALEQTR